MKEDETDHMFYVVLHGKLNPVRDLNAHPKPIAVFSQGDWIEGTVWGSDGSESQTGCIGGCSGSSPTGLPIVESVEPAGCLCKSAKLTLCPCGNSSKDKDNRR